MRLERRVSKLEMLKTTTEVVFLPEDGMSEEAREAYYEQIRVERGFSASTTFVGIEPADWYA